MTAYLALGSNRGDRAAQLAAAVAALPAAGVRVLRRSRWIETLPVGATGRAKFLNGVIEVETALLPGALLRRLQAIERRLGRHPLSGGKNTPRSVDLDLIFYGRAVIRTPELNLPHPRWAEREFVLAGLRELGVVTARLPGAPPTLGGRELPTLSPGAST